MIKILSCLFIIIGFASTATAIQCYACSSPIHADCADLLGSNTHEHIVDCNAMQSPFNKMFEGLSLPNATACLKTKAEVNGMSVTIRQCYLGDASKADEACEQSEKALEAMNSKQLVCEVCNTNLCNGSTSTGTLTEAVISLIVLVVHMMS